jgi:hypothetical protein
MPKSAMSGQRAVRRSRDSGHPGASLFAHDDRFSRSVPWDERKYVVLTNRGDEYLERIEVGKWEACKLHFLWTTNRDEAQVFTGAEIRASFYHVVQAFSAPKLERVF